MNPITRLIAPLLALALAAPASFAVPITYRAILSGPNENPPNASPGTGVAYVTLDTTANTLAFDVTFSGLIAPTIAAHIHCCTLPPNNVGVVVPAAASLPGFPLGVMLGTYQATLDTSDASTYRAAFITANGNIDGAEAALETGLLGGQAYFNIHTSNTAPFNGFPGGEIRGFLQRIPEPSSFGLFGLGLAAFAFARRLKQ